MSHSLTSPSNLSRTETRTSLPLVVLEEDLCLPVEPRPRFHRPLTVLDMPAPARPDGTDPDDPFEDLSSPPRPRSRRREMRPTFVPLQPETFVAAKDPWAVNSVLDLLRFFLPEVSISTALAALSGLLAGKFVARWAGGIEPLWILGLYLAIHLLNLGNLYLAGKGTNSSRLKSALRQLVLGMFLLFLPHAVAFALLSAGY